MFPLFIILYYGDVEKSVHEMAFRPCSRVMDYTREHEMGIAVV